MSTVKILAIASLIGASIGLANAQPADAASAPATKSMDCSKMAKHDHGSDRGMPAAHSGGCADAPAAAASDAPKKKRVNHDHSKIHKNS